MKDPRLTAARAREHADRVFDESLRRRYGARLKPSPDQDGVYAITTLAPTPEHDTQHDPEEAPRP